MKMLQPLSGCLTAVVTPFEKDLSLDWIRGEKMYEENQQKRFTGGSKYVLDEELAKIVNISMALEMPLLLKGEPGTGKTM